MAAALDASLSAYTRSIWYEQSLGPTVHLLALFSHELGHVDDLEALGPTVRGERTAPKPKLEGASAAGLSDLDVIRITAAGRPTSSTASSQVFSSVQALA